MSTLFQDVRYGLRMLVKNPGFTAVAVVTLALGIGANTAVFSWINSMLLKPFPFRDLDRIVAVTETAPKQSLQGIPAAPANFHDWQEQTKSFESLAAVHGWNVNLTREGVAERLEGFQVTTDFFHLLGMEAHLGRPLNSGDFAPGHTSVVVLSYGFWQRALAGDPSVVGKTLLLDGSKFTVVGVMPEEFDYPVGAQAWAPLDLTGEPQADRTNHYLQVIGRLKPQVSREQAGEDLAMIAARLARQYPQTNGGHSVEIKGMVDSLVQGSKQFLTVLMGAAAFVLLLACANVANLQLARATTRSKEIAMRTALGATSGRIVRQLLTESVLLALAGGVAGAFLANWVVEFGKRDIPPFILQHIVGLKHTHVDSRVLAFTLGVAVASGILSGLARALKTSRPDLNEALKQGSRTGGSGDGHHRLRALLVVSEVALAQILLVATGLMVAGFRNLMNEYPGYDRSHILTFRLALPEGKYREKSQVRNFYDEVLQRMHALSGVESAACMSSLPSAWSWNQVEYTAEGQPPAAPGELRLAVSQSVTPEVFRVLRIPLRAGRLIGSEDGAEAPPVVVLNETLAHRIWPNQSPLGKKVRFGSAASQEPWRTVVGVVENFRQWAMDPEPHAVAYFPFAQLPEGSTSLAMRTFGDPLALVAAARTAVRGVDAGEPLFDIRSLDQMFSDNLSGVKASADTMIQDGVIALLLAASGIFAVMAYFVLQRTHEIGVRMALGARRADVLRLVLARSGKHALLGFAIGVPVSMALSRAISGFLFGIFRLDTTIFILLTLLLALIAALAAYVPARWATKVDPMVALRYE